MKDFESLGLKHQNEKLLVLDQTLLPAEEVWLECKTVDQMVEMIQMLRVRGAPLIGVAAAASLAKFAETDPPKEQWILAAKKLRDSRPTAVNLMTCVDRMIESENPVKCAEEIFVEDVRLCEQIGEHGANLIDDGDGVLTHCNAGGLATAGIGTAVGVIVKAHQQGKKFHVYVDETRPLLQGGRLTAWEMEKWQIPYTLICDNMAASLMRDGRIQKVFVGADRIASNGDFANKIGTYNVAVLAKHHNVPFYPAAPYTTIDRHCEKGTDIQIEQRDPNEVRGFVGKQIVWSPKEAPVTNPAFDVTTADLVTKFVLDSGVRDPANVLW